MEAQKVATVDAPDPAQDIPWLKLQVTKHFGGGPKNNGRGVFGGTTFVQRIDTSGGVAPVAVLPGTAPGTQESVPYEATYCFWGVIFSATGGL